MTLRFSLRPLLVGGVAILLAAVVLIIALLTMRSLSASQASIGTALSNSTKVLESDLRERLERINANQAKAAEAALEAKALATARVIAGLVSTSLVIADADGINTACSLIDQDSELVVAIVHDAKGAMVSTHWPKKAQQLMGPPAGVAERIAAAVGAAAIREIRTPIVSDGQRLGEVQIIASTALMQEQIAAVAKQIEATISAETTQLAGTQRDVVQNIGVTTSAMRWQIIIAGLAGVLVASALFFVLAGWIVTPIREMVAALRRVAAGDYAVVLSTRGTTEVVAMAEALGRTVATLNAQRSGINDAAQALAAQATQMTRLAEDMATGASATSSEAAGVASATETVSTSVTAVASAANEMAACVKEISVNTTEAARIAGDAVGGSERARAAMARLNEASQGISAIVATIGSIAAQTNLLALNATIEAARAGDSGRGFAVVAGEVKQLARQSGEATGDIAGKIREIQELVKASADEMVEVGKLIQRINEIQTVVAGAVEEQSATTTEMVSSLGTAAQSGQQVAGSVKQVATAASHTAEGAAQARSAAAGLAKLAEDLRALIGRTV